VVRFPLRTENFFLYSKVSKLFLGPTYAIISWVPASSPRSKVAGDHHSLEPRLRMSGAIPPLKQVLLLRAQGLLYIYLFESSIETFVVVMAYHSWPRLNVFI
jgi:hypothetical protein